MNKLYIEATSRCNLNCEMCFRHKWIDEPQGDMDDAVFKKICDSLNLMPELENVMFAGMGEPLVHKNIVGMVRGIKNAGKNAEILTNGFLLDERMTDSLLDAGLDELWISADGFSKESYEKIQHGALFERMYKNLTYFVKKRKRCRLGITFVMMKENISELKKINRFADDFSADEINLSYCIPSEPIKKEDTVYDAGYPIGKMYRLKGHGEYAKNFCPFIEEEKCFVKWNGEVCPCMQLLHGCNTYFYEEERRIFFKSFGNAAEIPLKDIWECEEYTNFRKKVHDFEFPDCTLCDGCDDRLSNETDCMFNEMPTCGACLWAQGTARCP